MKVVSVKEVVKLNDKFIRTEDSLIEKNEDLKTLRDSIYNDLLQGNPSIEELEEFSEMAAMAAQAIKEVAEKESFFRLFRKKIAVL